MCLQHTRKLALLKGKACKALCGQKISLFGVLIGSRNGGDAVCSPSFCWSFGVKIVQTESRDCKLACKLCRGAAYLGLGGKDSANREQSLKLAYKLCRGAAYLDLGDKVMY